MSYQKYDAYFNCDIPWLNNLPKHWAIEKVKYIFKETSIKNHGKETMLAATQHRGVIPKDELEFKSVEAVVTDLNVFKLVNPNNFVISLRSFEGGIEHSPYKGIISPAYTVMQKKIDLDELYFKFLFKSSVFINALNVHKTGIREGQNISFSKFKEDFLPFPSLEEQKAIAEFIDKKTSQIDTHIDKQERLIALLKERRTAIINKAVTRGLDENVKLKDSGIDWLGEIPEHWEVKKLQYLVKINNAALSDKTKPSKIIQYIDIGQVDGNGLSSEPQKMIFQEAPSRARRKVKYGDVIISTVRTYLKAIAFIESKDDDIIASTGFATLTASKLILPEFLRYAVHNNTFLESVSASSEGIAYPAITANKIGKFKIPYPPSLTEQEKIVKYIDEENRKVDSALNIINKEIAALKEYRQSIISNAVTGKIRVI